ncbi:MAG: nodulation protein NfeD [Pseudomonadota bacterium]
MTQQRHRLWFFSFLFALGAGLFGLSALAQEESRSGNGSQRNGVILTLNGPVTPANADYLDREIGNASDAGAELIIIEIDTPGGLVDSMKTIIKAILGSETPVATFVSPQGARSASAGLYIMYGAHISAMAPSTNTGAATPVEVGGGGGNGENPFGDESPFGEETPGGDAVEDAEGAPVEGIAGEEGPDGAAEGVVDETIANEPIVSPIDGSVEGSEEDESGENVPVLGNNDALRAKVINDSVAYIRALAEERGRNADWAESAVREAASITSREALELGVIDLIADDIDDLLTQIDGRTVTTVSGERVLQTSNVVLERVEPTVVEAILGFIANPNVAVILMSLATTGIIAEIWNPGSIFPGLLGIIFLLLGLYSFSVLPYNQLGAGLMAVGAVLIFVEAFLPTAGFAGLTGLIVFGAGMYLVFPEGFRLSPVVVGSILATVGLFLGAIFVALVGSRSHGPMIGGEAIRRREGVVDEWEGREGWVIVEGERWRARSDRPLNPGDKIRVVEIDGLILVVKQAKAGSFLGGLSPSEA